MATLHPSLRLVRWCTLQSLQLRKADVENARRQQQSSRNCLSFKCYSSRAGAALSGGAPEPIHLTRRPAQWQPLVTSLNACVILQYLLARPSTNPTWRPHHQAEAQIEREHCHFRAWFSASTT
eukprot:585529-Amphidinium_carterae.1